MQELRRIIRKLILEVKELTPAELEKQKAFTDIYGEKNYCKNSNYLSESCLSLPMYPHLAEKDVLKVCKVIKKII